MSEAPLKWHQLGVLAVARLRREARQSPPPAIPPGADWRPVEGFPGYAIGRDRSVWTSWTAGGIRGPWRRMAPVMRGRNKTSPTVILTGAEGRRRFFPVARLHHEAFVRPPLPPGDPGLEELEDLDADDLAVDRLLGMPDVPPLARPPRPRQEAPASPPARVPGPSMAPAPMTPRPAVERPSGAPQARGSDHGRAYHND